jgi:hypothetical protein
LPASVSAADFALPLLTPKISRAIDHFSKAISHLALPSRKSEIVLQESSSTVTVALR